MRITLGGDLGSGKSSVGRRLSEKLGIPYVSAGKLFREIGQIANLDALATNLEAESNTGIDAQVDQRTKDLDRDLPDFIIDSRMAWHFVSNAVRVYLSVRAATAARRILADSTRDTESYPDLDSALVKLRRRRDSERKRYRTLYGVDIEDRKNYDLWLITDDATIDDICEIILAFVSERTRHRDWIPKVRLVPLTGAPDDCTGSSASCFGPSDDFVLPVAVSDNFGLVFEGTDSMASALDYETTLIPYRATLPASPPRSADPIDTAKRLVSEEQLNAWEACSGVRFSFREILRSEPEQVKAATNISR
jgi:predicted cytidylate kinase